MSLWTSIVASLGWPKQDEFDGILRQFEAGKLAIPVALMELVYLTTGPADLEERLADAVASGWPGLRKLQDFARQHPNAHSIVHRMEAVRTQRDSGVDEKSYWSSEYDRLVSVSPLASVALYSFGDPALLDAMTDELVEWLRVRRLLKPGARVLDYGCGIGRILARIAPLVGEAVGVDISEAHARLATAGNVRLKHAKDLETDPAGEPFDLILLIGVLPHIGDPFPVLHDLAGRLAPGGSLVVLDWSFTLSSEDQGVLADRLAQAEGLVLGGRAGAKLTFSAGEVFHFSRPSAGAEAGARN
jgi:2-polyprenyl-3-methyl-5-hydroxy-6-metoxy-1,4-benzoquinol methylase